MQRDNRIDSIRGILLVLMTIGHFGGPVARATYEFFGYVSVAEGFIFLSGYVFAIVYMRHISDSLLLIKKSLRRSFIIYKYHIVIAVALIPLSYLFPHFKIYWSGWLGHFYYTDPYLYIKLVALLIHMPKYMTILPIYSVFVLLTPVILIAFNKGIVKLVLFLSFAFWLLGQYIDPMNIFSNFFCQECRPGYFNILSWQIIWVAGIYLGFMHYSNKPINMIRHKIFNYTACAISVILFLSRHELLNIGFDTTLAIYKPDLAWLRSLNFFVLVITIWFLMRKIPAEKGIPWVEFIGKYSLQVYAYHVLLIYILKPVTFHLIKAGSIISYAIYTSLIVISLTIPAIVYKNYKKSALTQGA